MEKAVKVSFIKGVAPSEVRSVYNEIGVERIVYLRRLVTASEEI